MTLTNHKFLSRIEQIRKRKLKVWPSAFSKLQDADSVEVRVVGKGWDNEVFILSSRSKFAVALSERALIVVSEG